MRLILVCPAGRVGRLCRRQQIRPEPLDLNQAMAVGETW